MRTLSPSSSDPRFNHSTDMVANAQRFVAELKAKHYPGLPIKMTTTADEDPMTVFPAVITRGLLWALPPRRG